MDHNSQFCPPCGAIFKGMEREEEMGEEERRGKEKKAWSGGVFQIDLYLLNSVIANLKNIGPELCFTHQHSFPSKFFLLT